MLKLGIGSEGHIGKDSNYSVQQKQVKRHITELSISLLSQSTVSFLPICVIRYQRLIDLAFGFLPGILFRGQNLLLCKLLLFQTKFQGEKSLREPPADESDYQ